MCTPSTNRARCESNCCAIGFRMSSLLFLVTNLAASTLLAAAAEPGAESQMLLRKGWAIQSSADVHEDGAAISTPGFKARDWYAATLPSTVLSALVQDRVYPDPYYGHEPAVDPGHDLSHLHQLLERADAARQPVPASWWYRTEFKFPAEYRGKTALAGFRRRQLPRQRLAERAPDRVRRSAGGHVAPLRVRRHRRGPSRARRMRSPSRSFRPSRTTSPSPSWTGTRCRPTRRWASGATSTSPPRARSPCATRPSSRS